MTISGPPLNRPRQLRELLAAGLAREPDAAAITSAEGRISWRQLDASSTTLAANLIALGLNRGDRVASLMPNRIALVVHYLACLKAALVATPLNYRYLAPQIDHALEVSGASLLIAHRELHSDLAATRLVNHLPLGVIWYGAGQAAGPNDRPALEDLMAGAPQAGTPQPEPADGVEPIPLRAEDPAFIFFTSGSTGSPKGVTHSARSLGSILASFVQSAGITANDVILPGSSLSQIAAVQKALAGLSCGSPLIVARTLDAEEILPLLRAHRPTILSMLPAALFAIVRDHGGSRQDFACLRVMFAGGDKVSDELEREFTELTGLPIDELYGMSEFGCSMMTPPSARHKPGSVGPLVAGFQAQVRDDTGTPLPHGQEGRLWIRSPNTMAGYWNNPRATEETIVDGWLDTGDVMVADADDYLFFRGRRKQIIVHDGSNICPQEVEGALLQHPALQDVGVVGFRDLLHGENVRAYVTLRPGASRPTGQELIRFARERVGYKAPEEIVVLREMPLNPTGKLDRVTLKRIAAEQHRTDPSILVPRGDAPAH